MAPAPEAVLAFVSQGDGPVLTIAPPLTFDGRDVADAPVAPEVVGFGLIPCAACGTLRDSRFIFCCEFAAEAAAESPTQTLAATC